MSGVIELKSTDDILNITHSLYHYSSTIYNFVETVIQFNICDPFIDTHIYVPNRLSCDVFSAFGIFTDRLDGFKCECPLYYDKEYDIYVTRNIKLNCGKHWLDKLFGVRMCPAFKEDNKYSSHSYYDIPQNAIVFVYAGDNSVSGRLLKGLKDPRNRNKVIMFDLIDMN